VFSPVWEYWSATIAKLSYFVLAAVITIMSRSTLTSVAYSVGPLPLSNYKVLLSKRLAWVVVIVLHNVSLNVMGSNLITVMRDFSAPTVPSPAQSLQCWMPSVEAGTTHLTSIFFKGRLLGCCADRAWLTAATVVTASTRSFPPCQIGSNRKGTQQSVMVALSSWRSDLEWVSVPLSLSLSLSYLYSCLTY